ncbi:hypothetical protein ACUN9V_04950 [Salinicola sp. V024]|uniref:hypothetical protein n=1 Tax=Salinicola sp. V024 TaxID=3459609 RepID=UPI004044166B
MNEQRLFNPTPDQERLADETIARAIGQLAQHQQLPRQTLKQSATDLAAALRAGFEAFSRPEASGSSPQSSDEQR